jgi:hypothetical protein
MRLFFINNDGGGFADSIEVADGLTVAGLFEQRMPGRKPSDYLIRVNRLPAAADQQLREGDRVSFSPTKVMGAMVTLPRARAA